MQTFIDEQKQNICMKEERYSFAFSGVFIDFKRFRLPHIQISCRDMLQTFINLLKDYTKEVGIQFEMQMLLSTM